MRVHILAIGRARRGPETELVRDYLERYGRTGRALGLGPPVLRDLDERKGGDPAREAALLRGAIPDGALIVALDERGKTLSSPEFANQLGTWRDGGTRDVAFLIGGADGLEPALRAEAGLSLSFGRMVWPHMLVRVMLAEQLYRAATILSGGPYHRA